MIVGSKRRSCSTRLRCAGVESNNDSVCGSLCVVVVPRSCKFVLYRHIMESDTMSMTSGLTGGMTEFESASQYPFAVVRSSSASMHRQRTYMLALLQTVDGEEGATVAPPGDGASAAPSAAASAIPSRPIDARSRAVSVAGSEFAARLLPVRGPPDSPTVMRDRRRRHQAHEEGAEEEGEAGEEAAPRRRALQAARCQVRRPAEHGRGGLHHL